MKLKMKFKGGLEKVLTLSYDDGVVQDIRLIDIFNKYGLKSTFNINTGLYADENVKREKFYGRMKLNEAKELYINSGHELAVHTLTHPYISQLRDNDVLIEVLEDKRNIEQQYKTIARGMAYPYGTYSDSVISILKSAGIVYSRTVNSTEKFELPEDWLRLNPTCHHSNPRLMELAKAFVEEKNLWGDCKMFYVWGHSYEFDDNDNWELIEEFAQYISNKDDIWYATNIEIYDYVKAFEALQSSVDGNIVYNPSAITLWFEIEDKDGNKKNYKINSGETIIIDN